MKENNKYQALLTKSTDCIITVSDLKDKKVDEIIKVYKTSAWDLAKMCYLFNKVQGIKLDTLADRFGIDTATIGKHAVNVAFLLDRYGKGFDKFAHLYSISKVDMLRKAFEAGAMKKTPFEDAIKKTRKDIETAMKRAKKGDTTDKADTDKADTVEIHMIGPDNEEITRVIPADTWKQWVQEAKGEEA